MKPENDTPDTAYHVQSTNLPPLGGWMLRWFVRVLESPLKRFLASNLFRQIGITAFRKQSIDTAPTFLPLWSREHHDTARSLPTTAIPESKPNTPGFQFATIHDYASAYREGHITPEEVAESTLHAIKASDKRTPALRAFLAVDESEVMRMAKESTQRIHNKTARSLLEGVPVAVKDEIDMVPYPTTAGTSFGNSVLVDQDATVVARLRAAGALLLGKTNMHEIGIGVTGHNPHYGTPRNPYSLRHHTGGSSSGSAAAVAAGLCPVALGADGGGSIRIPSAFCGVVGLKSTFGRVSGTGTAELARSVVHLGPLTASATDAAVTYSLIAGPDPEDPDSISQPLDTVDCWDPLEYRQLTIGIYRPWFEDAEPAIVTACNSMVQEYEQAGAQIRPVTIPHLEECRVAHTITIGSEMLASSREQYKHHQKDYSLDTRSSLALVSAMTAQDYLKAQQYRTQLMENLRHLFQHVDVILTPATGMVAPAIPEQQLPAGGSDISAMMKTMRFAQLANLTGVPAITFPVGYTTDNLPIGMQAMAAPWKEQTLLQLALAVEQILERRKPEMMFKPLETG